MVDAIYFQLNSFFFFLLLYKLLIFFHNIDCLHRLSILWFICEQNNRVFNLTYLLFLVSPSNLVLVSGHAAVHHLSHNLGVHVRPREVRLVRTHPNRASFTRVFFTVQLPE